MLIALSLIELPLYAWRSMALFLYIYLYLGCVWIVNCRDFSILFSLHFLTVLVKVWGDVRTCLTQPKLIFFCLVPITVTAHRSSAFFPPTKCMSGCIASILFHFSTLLPAYTQIHMHHSTCTVVLATAYVLSFIKSIIIVVYYLSQLFVYFHTSIIIAWYFLTTNIY